MEHKDLRILIVDDEPDARHMLEELLSNFPEIENLDKASNAEEALKSLKRQIPDLIFLDIEMPGKDGIELAKEIRDLNIDATIIFVTAFNQHAIDAFKVAAFDYILKPIDPDELERTLERFKAERQKYDLAEKLDKLSKCLAPEKVRFNTRSGFIVVDPKSIVYCEADGNYTHIYLNSGKKEHINQQLGKIEETLNNPQFVRTNRSVLINKDYISSFDRKTRKIKLVNVLEEMEFRVNKSQLSKIW